MEDWTQKMVDFLNQRLVGKEVHTGWETVERHTGYEIRAKGQATIDSYISHEGKLLRESLDSIGIIFWITNPHLKISFRYRGQTTAESISSPGGLVFDHPWGDLHPAGSITAILHFRPREQATLKLEIDVDADHNDRPGFHIRDNVMPQFIGVIDSLMEEFTGGPVYT